MGYGMGWSGVEWSGVEWSGVYRNARIDRREIKKTYYRQYGRMV